MASWQDVRRLAMALPETSERPSYDGAPAWRVKDKLFAWERPLRKSDFEALGDEAPDGPVLGVRVADLGAKEELLAAAPELYFTTPHFDGYPIVLVRLDEVSADELEELVTDAWLARAPKRLAAAFLSDSAGPAGGAAPG